MGVRSLSKLCTVFPDVTVERQEHSDKVVQQDNKIKHRRAWLLLGWVTAERSCPCKQPACPAIGDGSEVIFKSLVLRLSVGEGLLALTSPVPWCPTVFDGWSCWDSTPPGTRAFIPCPRFVTGFDPSRTAFRNCLENGTWFRHPATGRPWSNYTTCVDLYDLRVTISCPDLLVFLILS
ncbi:hypothetical protein J6590_085737 [Homalodisca vitripennis]|nr:hypothetical protein J6590_085737 [Homalodisca vitripennis]